MLKWIRVYAVLSGVVAISLMVMPLLAFALNSFLPHQLGNFMFFWPQYVLVPVGFTKNSPPFETFMFDSSVMLAIAFWLTFLALVAAFVRRWRVKWVALAAFPLALATVALYRAGLSLIGLGVGLDAP